MAIRQLAQALLFTSLLLVLPTTAHTPMRQYIAPPIPKQEHQQTVTYTTFEVTAYTKSDRGMSGMGVTANGKKARQWHTVAASRNIPYGTRIFIPQLGRTFVVEDRGGKKWIDGKSGIDIFVDSRAEALRFGRKRLKGIILP